MDKLSTFAALTLISFPVDADDVTYEFKALS